MVRLTGVTASGTPNGLSGPPRGVLADTSRARPTVSQSAAADPERAATARTYPQDTAPFLGLTTPDRPALSRTVLLGTPVPDEADRTAVAPGRRRPAEREYRYFAVDRPRRHVRRLSSGFPPVARQLVPTAPLWDTIDPPAAHVVGGLVAAGAKPRPGMGAWAGERGKPFDGARPVSDDRLMFRYAFPHAASAVADATKAAVLITVAAAAGARS
ncbi:DNA alkylation repair protein [Streptomyces sp. FR-108]|uniref:DNA alkylation repair protein n=1 Tax=Streptomyces sp. FR-108 TaxID=3416665 RepID=UPI003CFA403E